MIKNKLNKIATHPLQTSYWVEFRKSWGNEILETKYGIITVHRLPLTGYRVGMFIRGPKPTKEMLFDLKNIANKNNLIFIKLEPNVTINSNIKNKKLKSQIKSINSIKLLKENGCVPGKTLFTPTSFQIDLTKSEDELMKSFHPKTRYNIRLAEKKGVKVIEDPTSLKLRGAGNSNDAFERYIDLMRETVERQGFYAHTEKYHRLMWHNLNEKLIAKNEKPVARLLVAKYNGEIITTWILFVWRDMLYYPYGASTDKYKDVQANSAMMWGAIKFGKKLGLKKFDLWGREEGKGFTRFKEGFNPEVVEYLGTWDLVINKPMYELYKTGEKFRWTLLRTKVKLGLNRYSF